MVHGVHCKAYIKEIKYMKAMIKTNVRCRATQSKIFNQQESYKDTNGI